jgi:HSP20 family protein
MSTGSVVPFGWGGSMLPRHTSNDDPFIRLWNDVDRLFGDVMQGAQGTGLAGRRPAGTIGLPLEVRETGAELRVVAELPGVEEKDVSVELVGDVLTIKGEKRTGEEREGEGYHLAERRYGTFARTLRLPFAAEADEVRATFGNGVLTVTVPKPAELRQRQPQRIEVKAAA